MIAVPLPSGSLAVGGPSGFGAPSRVAVSGRLLSEGGYRHLGMAVPKGQKQQLDLLAGQGDDAVEEA